MQIASLLQTVLDVYMLLILARVLLSWISVDRSHPAVRFIERGTEPVLAPLRSLIGVHAGLDLSPVVAILVLSFLRRLVTRIF